MVQYRKPRWTHMEHVVLGEFIERDSKARPLGRCVRCCHCCYRPECAKMTYIVFGILLFVGLAFLITFYVLLIHPTVESALYADRFRPATCDVINSTYLAEKESCRCGPSCWRNYPCLHIRVSMTSSDGAVSTHAFLFMNTRTLKMRKCAYIPVECAPYAYLMERDIDEFKKNYGRKGQQYGCLHNPDKPYEVVLTRQNNDFNVKYLHFIVWPAVVIGLCFVTIFTAYSICGCLPYICFRHIPMDVKEEAQNRETEITMKNANIENYRTIPDFTATTGGPGEIRWKEYSYGETSDPV